MNFISNHVSSIEKNVDFILIYYDHVFLTGDFNAEIRNYFLEEFCHLYNLKT